MEQSDFQVLDMASSEQLASSSSDSSDTFPRDALFNLMVVARDHQLTNNQIRLICEKSTNHNINDQLELVRHFHPSQRLGQKYNSAIGTDLDVRRLIINLSGKDLEQVRQLKRFCPFGLAGQKCIHRQRCQLKRLCFAHKCRYGKKCKDCKFSHEVLSTCAAVIRGEKCDKTGHNFKKRDRCFLNHDIDVDVRLFMGAMRLPHELGFYGVGSDDARGNTFGGGLTAEEVTESVMVERMLHDSVPAQSEMNDVACQGEDPYYPRLDSPNLVWKDSIGESASSGAEMYGLSPIGEEKNDLVLTNKSLRSVCSDEDLITL